MQSILYLEDEPWQVDGTVVSVLRIEYAYQVKVVASADKAEAELQKSKYDALVVDIMLDPNKPISYQKSAFEMLGRIKEGVFAPFGNEVSVPVVIASGVLDAVVTWLDGERIKVREGLSRIGIASECCIAKPFTAEELHMAIQSAIANSGRVA